MARLLGLSPLLALTLSGCGPQDSAPESPTAIEQVDSRTPKCDQLLKLGQMDRFAAIDLNERASLDDVMETLFNAPIMAAAGSVAINKTVLGQCETHQAHAKGLDPESPTREIIRMVLVEPSTDDTPAIAVAAGERSLCDTTSGPVWMPGTCS